MALTAYCKKCNREVQPGEICPRCGTKLAKNAVHAAWVVERRPVADWMCWNAVMRWLLPAGMAVLLLVLALEALSGGTEAVERLFRGSFPLTLGLLLAFLLLLVLLALVLQGPELMDYVVDSRGIHVTRYLPEPTPLKLLVRLKSPALTAGLDPENPVLQLESRDLAWKDVARVQLWPEKCYILFYAPAWWLRIPVRCTPFSWEDALVFVREKLGKKKAVEMPEHLRVQAGKKPAPARRSGPARETARETAGSPRRAAEPVTGDPGVRQPAPVEDPPQPAESGKAGDPWGRESEEAGVPWGTESGTEDGLRQPAPGMEKGSRLPRKDRVPEGIQTEMELPIQEEGTDV